jgi:hypothetical protein
MLLLGIGHDHKGDGCVNKERKQNFTFRKDRNKAKKYGQHFRYYNKN